MRSPYHIEPYHRCPVWSIGPIQAVLWLASWNVMSQPRHPSMWMWPAVCNCGNGFQGHYINPKADGDRWRPNGFAGFDVKLEKLSRSVGLSASPRPGASEVDNASVAKHCWFKVFPVAQGQFCNHTVYEVTSGYVLIKSLFYICHLLYMKLHGHPLICVHFR